MKRRNIAFACVGAGVWLVGCGGGTLGGGVSTGGGGNIMITGSSAASGQGVAGNSGLGGDGAPVGGIGGAAGRPGRGGAGGVSAGFSGSMGPGSGGSGFISCPPPPPVCGALCGNGKQDNCIRSLAPGCQPQVWSEECDGADFAGDTCALRGFASGTLVCKSDCTIDYDASNCSECAPAVLPIARCGKAPTQFAYVSGFALGATDTEVGFATFSDNDASGMILSFARLTSTLDLAGGWINVEDTPGTPDSIRIYDAAVAPLPAGWVLAACGYPQVFFHTIDASGREFARTVVDTVSDLYDACISGSLTLAPRPGGGPLLLWRSGSDVMAALIAGDGLSVSAPQAIVGPTTFINDTVSAAWVVDAFYAAVALQNGSGDGGVIRLVRFQPGATPIGGDLPVNEPVQSAPVVVPGVTDLRLVYNGLITEASGVETPAVLLRRLGTSGELLSNPFVLARFPTLYGPPLAAGFTGATVVLINSSYVTGRLSFLTVASDGSIATPAYDVARTPFYLGPIKMVRRGSDVVVGWLGGGDGLRLARVTP